MAPVRPASDFIDRCNAATSVVEVRAALFSATSALGYRFVACCSHVDPLRPPPGAVNLINYPQAWLDRFSEENFAARDPVFLAAQRRGLPFLWRDLEARRALTPDQRDILREAAAVGLKDGLTIPIHMPNALPASSSLVPGPDGVDPLELADAVLISIYAHEKARALFAAPSTHSAREAEEGVIRLSRRQRECLALVGCGKSDGVIAEILGLHERTVHHHIESAKRRYGVATRIQAVVRAIFGGEIACDDIDWR